MNRRKFLTEYEKKLYFTLRVFFPKIAHFHGDLDAHLMHDSLEHPSPQPERYLDRFSSFAQMTAKCPYTL